MLKRLKMPLFIYLFIYLFIGIILLQGPRIDVLVITCIDNLFMKERIILWLEIDVVACIALGLMANLGLLTFI